MEFKKILFFKQAFIKVARTTKLSHHPVLCLLCQSRLWQHVSSSTVAPWIWLWFVAKTCRSIKLMYCAVFGEKNCV